MTAVASLERRIGPLAVARFASKPTLVAPAALKNTKLTVSLAFLGSV
jgi:hypothetical protein